MSDEVELQSGLVAWACEGLPHKTDDELRALAHTLERLSAAELALGALKRERPTALEWSRSTTLHLQRVQAELDARGAPR